MGNIINMSRRKKITAESVKRTEKKSDKLPGRLLGMKDWSATDGSYFNALIDKAREFSKIYGFSPVVTPIMESFDLYKKSSRRGNDRDFYFVDGDKSDKAILRPELTQGALRTYLENNQGDGTCPTRLSSLGSIFRHEKPQNGHYRESNQFNLEILEDSKPLTEALLISLAVNFFKELGINVQVQINSLGTADCRREYCSRLLSFYKERGRRSKLCGQCKNGLGKHCLSLLDCQEEACLQVRSEAPQIADYLSIESRERLAKTLEFLDELNINYNFSPYLVRGLNYYNDTVFEFWPVNEDGTLLGKLALGGGGRYDFLAESFGGQPTAAIGLAIGLERTLARVRDKQALIQPKEEDIIFIAQLGDQAKLRSVELFADLRQAGFNVRQSFTSDSLKLQLEEAVTMRARTGLILGRKEIMDGTILMRDMDSGTQETVVYKKIKERLARKDKIIEKKITINRKEGGLYGGF